MKFVGRTWCLAFLVTAALAQSGCPQANTNALPDLAFPPDLSALPDLARVCAPSCNADSDCQNSCPLVSGGINCCDTMTHTCFSAQAATCPAPMPDMAMSATY